MVTDLHVRRLRRLDHQGLSKSQAAAKAGIDDKTARKYRRLGKLPSEVRMEHTWRTRPNPFAEVWSRVEEQLTLNPGLAHVWCCRPDFRSAVRTKCFAFQRFSRAGSAFSPNNVVTFSTRLLPEFR
jgi:hypothetical protein